MSEYQMEEVCCFLCLCKQIPGKIFTNAEATLCPGSQQPLKVVVEYLATAEKLDLQLTNNSLLCLECCKKVITYDEQKRSLLDNIRNWIKHANGEEVTYDPLLHVDIEDVKNSIEEDIKHNPLDFANNEELIEDYELLMDPNDADLLPFYNDLEKAVNVNPTEESKSPPRRGRKKTLPVIPPFQCLICELNFTNEKDIESHTKRMHKMRHNFKCDVCKFIHVDINYLLLHKNTHKGLTDKQCPYCQKPFKKRNHCVQHMEMHISRQKYQCDQCGLGFSQSSQFKTHKLKHEAEENPVICDICNKQFKTKNTYKKHIIIHQEDRPRYTCEHCGKVFVDKFSFQIHTEIHMNPFIARQYKKKPKRRRNKSLACIICSELFKKQEELDLHMKDNHDVIVEPVNQDANH